MEGRGTSPLCIHPLDVHHLSIKLQYRSIPLSTMCKVVHNYSEMEHCLPTYQSDLARYGREANLKSEARRKPARKWQTASELD